MRREGLSRGGGTSRERQRAWPGSLAPRERQETAQQGFELHVLSKGFGHLGSWPIWRKDPLPGLSASSQGRLSRRQPVHPYCPCGQALSTLSAYLTPRVQTRAGHRLPLPTALCGPDNPGPLLETGAPSVLTTKVPKQGYKNRGVIETFPVNEFTHFTHTPQT